MEVKELGYMVEIYNPWGSEFKDYAQVAINQWNAEIIEIPRTHGQKIVEEDYKDIETVGCYFLIEKINSINNINAYKAYVGQTTSIHDRVKKHLKEKQWWTKIIFFRTLSLNEGHMANAENKSWNILKINCDILVENKIKPPCTKPQTKRDLVNIDMYINEVINYLKWCDINILEIEIDEKQLEESKIENIPEIIKQVKNDILTIEEVKINELKLLDIKFVEEINNYVNDYNTLFYAYNRGCKAIGYPTRTGFLILKGSYYSDFSTDSFKKRGDGYKYRKYLLSIGLVKEEDILGEIKRVFIKDHHFPSRTAALDCLSGNATNPNKEFRTKNNVKLGDFELNI